MRILLTGATGFIGGQLLRALARRGHAVTALVRPGRATSIAAQLLPGVTALEAELLRPDDWTAQVAGHDVVVNAAGIIRESPGASFEQVHARAPIALFEAAAAAGVRRIVQLSALGADDGAATAYHRTKRAADRRLAELGVPYVVLRPSIVHGPGDASMTLFAQLAALPLSPVPGDGRYRLQPIDVADLVAAAVFAVEQDPPSGAYDLGGADALSFDELLDVLARWLGKPRARRLHIPWALMRLAAAWTDAVGRGPISGEELAMLARGNTCELAPFEAAFGFRPIGLAAALARRPPSEAQRWHARLAPLRLPLRASVAFIWLATGLISAFVYPEAASLELLAQVGVRGPLAPLALYGTSALEIALALAMLAGWRVRWMALGQLALMAGFMTILTLFAPEWWWHPFGPLTKNIPLIGATLALIAIEDER